MERICTPDPRELPGGSQSLPPSRLSTATTTGLSTENP